MNRESNEWYELESDENINLEYTVRLYDINSSPNDFNIKTYFDFINSGKVIIPTFQRNYVWDIKRASKLIESLIIGLPIPQIFLFGEGRNKYLVIDGQQRLLSIYYFIKGRFPKKNKRAEIRKKLIGNGGIIDRLLDDNEYYDDFQLSLSQNRELNKKTYETLGDEFLDLFDYRTIRNISIKQNTPSSDNNSSMYEIFNRLNIGGMNLTPQEIRSSVYHSEFYSMLQKINLNQRWRKFLNKEDLDLHQKDIEIILRGFTLALSDIKDYKGNMKQILNEFSSKAKRYTSEQIFDFEKMFMTFIDSCTDLLADSFVNKNKKFQTSIFDSVFYVWTKEYLNGKVFIISEEKFRLMRDDFSFKENTEQNTTNSAMVKERIKIAKSFLVS